MKIRSKLKAFALSFPLLLQFGSYAVENIKLKVIAEKGAALREGPDIKSKKMSILKYGTPLELMGEESEAEIIQILLPMEGRWLKVRLADKIGFIFSPLVENTVLNSYQCTKPDKPVKDISISRHDMKADFCGDGTYMIDNAYNCPGRCWEHGCWRVTKENRLELKRMKVSETRGIGKPNSCTHFCTYKAYRIVNETLPKENWKSEPDVEVFLEYYKAGEISTPQSTDIIPRNTRFSCKDSRQ